ncbi:unnamed protein product [Absidia cylindrospora]
MKNTFDTDQDRYSYRPPRRDRYPYESNSQRYYDAPQTRRRKSSRYSPGHRFGSDSKVPPGPQEHYYPPSSYEQHSNRRPRSSRSPIGHYHRQQQQQQQQQLGYNNQRQPSRRHTSYYSISRSRDTGSRSDQQHGSNSRYTDDDHRGEMDKTPTKANGKKVKRIIERGDIIQSRWAILLVMGVTLCFEN